MKRYSPLTMVLWPFHSAVLLWVVLLAPGLAPADDLYVDYNSDYTVSGNISYDNEYVSAYHPNAIYQDNYTNTVKNSLELGHGITGDGTYNLSGGSLTTYRTFVGSLGKGTFNQSGGTHTIDGRLTLGLVYGSSGTYELTYGSSAPSLSAKEEVIGDSGSGTFNHHAGTNTVFYGLFVGYSDSGTGVYNNYNGWVNAGTQYIGYSGTGTFNNFGSNTLSDYLYLGYKSQGNGTYNLNEGTLSASGEVIGVHGVGYFTQSNLSNNTVGLGGLTLGRWSGSSGQYDISSMYAHLSAASETIGDEGNGVFNHNYGASNQVAGDLILGKSGSGSGLYNMDSPFYGMASSLSASNLYVGYNGYGSFLQNAYSNVNLTNSLVLGKEVGSQGNYFLQGGTDVRLSADLRAKQEIIGYSGNGLFRQSGIPFEVLYYTFTTAHNIVEDLILGHQSGAVGEYQLLGGNLSAGREIVGNQGTGTFTQTSGWNGCTALILGAEKGGSGTYKFQNGLLNATQEYIGFFGSGTFTQSFGEHMAVYLTLGYQPNSQGTFNLQGGSLSADQETVGYLGTGVFNQSGGSNQVQNLLTIGGYQTDGGSGTYNYWGGILQAASVQVNPTGTLQGFGTISGNVNNAGVVHPSAITEPLTVAGKYTQAAGGKLQIDIVPSWGPYAYTKLGTTTASLDGKIKPVLVGGGYPQINQIYSGVVTSTGGVSGTFSGVDAPLTQVWSPIYHSDSVDLQFLAHTYAGAALHLNANELKLAKMLDLIAPGASGDMAAVLATIDAMDNVANIKNAYKQMSPEKSGSFSTLGFALAANQMRNLSQRITDLRFGAGNMGTALGSGSFNLTYSRVGGLMLAYNSSDLSGLITAKQEKVPASPWSVYLQPNLILGAQATAANQTGFDFTAAGFTLGADYRLRDDLLLGLATGYSHTGASFRGSGGAVTNNTWPIMVYAAYLPQPFYAFGSLGYNLNLLNLDRHLSFGGLSRTASGSTTGNQLNAYAETGYDFKVRRLVATPMVSLAYSQLWVNSYTESGAGSLSLGVGPQSATSLQTGVGAKMALPFRRNSTLMVPQVYASYQHEFMNDSRGLDARLSQGGSTFTWQTSQPQRDFAVVGANCTISQGRFTLQIDYNTELGRGNYTAHNVNAAVRWQF